MQQFTPDGQQFIQDLAQRYGVSTDAVITMIYAVMNGNGTMAQFSHPELGGAGQWMQGGMTMVGDMFNHGLKSTVDGLCGEISRQLMNQPGSFQPAQSQHPSSGPQSSGSNLFVSPAAAGHWWPGNLGSPSASGGQNNVRYAVFPEAHRLAVEIDGRTTVYDTLDHQIGGVSQQQGGNDALTFASQYGTLGVDSLPIVSGGGYGQSQQNFLAPAQNFAEPPAAAARPNDDVFAKIERLADLRQKGILTDQEFNAKKQELLSQI